MKAKQTVLAFLAAAAIAARGDITPSGDTSGASDTTTIQSAIDAAANGGTVTLGSGMFYINAQLMVTNGVTLAGQGWENTVIRQVAATPSEYTRVVTVSGGAKVEHVTLTGGRLTGTNDKSGGGAYVSNGTVSWCCITNNSVSEANTKFGGGVGLSQGAGGQVDHCIIADNSVSTSTGNEIGGGGIGAYRPLGPITIDSCLISGNRAIRTTGYGRGGGIGIEFMYQQNLVVVRNTTIVGNAAGEGETTSYGGAVFTGNDSGKKFTMLNCIIADNTTADASTSMHLSHDGGVDYCLFDIEADKVGANSLFGDPQFVDTTDGNYRLSSTSPAREAGMTYSGIGVDLDGIDFENPPSMGCYQSGGVAKVETPVFAPVSGTRFYPSTNVTITCGTENASIYYTLDGSDPTDSNTLYSGPIALEATTTVKARAYKAEMAPSAVVSATYVYKAPAPRPDGFSKYVEITLATNLAATAITTGVPALVKLSETTILGFDYDDFSFANGSDMMFTDANGDPLPHEVDTWNVNGESLVWVKLPSTAVGTAITMYYSGNAAASADSTDVWTGYTGVWHLEEATADTAANSYGMYANSTATEGINGHIAEHTKTNETGRFGKCFRTNDSTGWKAGNFNYGGVWVNDSGANSPIDGGENFTISGWFKHDTFDYAWDHIFYKRSRSDNGTSGAYVNAFAIESNSGTGSNPQIYPRGSGNKGTVALTENQGLQNTWAYITFVYDGTTCTVYKNGIQTGWVVIDACVDNDAPLVFGNNCNVAFGTMGDAAWNGWIDEVRFSKGSKDAAWVAAEYAAMNADATDIFTFAAAEDVGDTPPLAPIVLGEVSARPGTDYNGSAVTLAFTGDIPAGATTTAALTISRSRLAVRGHYLVDEEEAGRRDDRRPARHGQRHRAVAHLEHHRAEVEVLALVRREHDGHVCAFGNKVRAVPFGRHLHAVHLDRDDAHAVDVGNRERGLDTNDDGLRREVEEVAVAHHAGGRHVVGGTDVGRGSPFAVRRGENRVSDRVLHLPLAVGVAQGHPQLNRVGEVGRRAGKLAPNIGRAVRVLHEAHVDGAIALLDDGHGALDRLVRDERGRSLGELHVEHHRRLVSHDRPRLQRRKQERSDLFGENGQP